MFLMILRWFLTSKNRSHLVFWIGSSVWSLQLQVLPLFSLEMVFYVNCFMIIFALLLWIQINSNLSCKTCIVVLWVVIYHVLSCLSMFRNVFIGKTCFLLFKSFVKTALFVKEIVFLHKLLLVCYTQFKIRVSLLNM